MMADSDSGDEERGKCLICGRITDVYEHEVSNKHRLNFVLWEFAKYRKPVSKDRNGVEIKITTKNKISNNILKIETNTKRGEFTTELMENEMIAQKDGVTYNFEVIAKKPIYLMHCHTLHPYPQFKYTDCREVLSNGSVAQLEEGATYSVTLKCDAQNVGEYRMPIAFRFQTIDNKEIFSIVKEMVIRVFSDRSVIGSIKYEKSPFTKKQWDYTKIYTIVDPIRNFILMQHYPIPPEEKNILMSGFMYWNGMSQNDRALLGRAGHILSAKSRLNYKEFYHYLLWLDEIGAELKIHCYNMENVRVKIRDNNIIELEVPGLAEKRPSLVRGDDVKMREHDAPVVYCGTVKEVREKDISINQISPEFINRILANPTGFLDVQFDINRLVYERMHKAVDLCTVNDKLDMLFPTTENNTPNKHQRFRLTNNQYVNKNIRENEEQQHAVMNILNNTSGNAPYLVFGPPGTGKTVTIVEAIVQIVRHIPSSTVLVCAPANAACDMLVVKLSQYFTKKQLIRIHSETADWKSVPDIVKEYSNRMGNTCKKISGMVLQNYKVVVTTLMSIGKYANAFTATHVFIDEAAQAMEPEALIAIGGILSKDGQVVLAGDPKQLGPMCNSAVAEKRGLGVSLLARLMGTQLYMDTNRDLFITKLILNYRNHPDILQLPNELFYMSELRAVSLIPLHDQINKVILPINLSKNMKPQAVEFYGVNGTEEREGRSPSFFNKSEIQAVMKYVRALTDPTADAVVQPEEIGVITPYIRQVYRIRGCMQNGLEGVEVGTTETFQGREKRVIIISTVRAKASLLLHDAKYGIGFVNNPERFNVAVTRAISKLIIIGNPHCLGNNKIWLQMINFCQEKRSYRGCHYSRRDDALVKQLLDNMGKVEYKPKNQQNNNNANNRNGRRRN